MNSHPPKNGGISATEFREALSGPDRPEDGWGSLRVIIIAVDWQFPKNHWTLLFGGV